MAEKQGKKKKSRARGQTQRKGAPAAVKVLTELEQIRVLADPLRVSILEIMAREEHTTKQVAQLLGEKPTKLYHHVEALERVGLIRMARTRQNRGTLEKYYVGVARRFEASSSLFSDAAEGEGNEAELPQMISMLLEKTGDELRRLAASGAEEDAADEAMLGLVEIHADQPEIDRIRRRVRRLLGDLQCGDEEVANERERRYRLMLAFFPLDR